MQTNNTITVLIVDDEVYVLEILREQLSILGYNIVTASSAEVALQKAEELNGIDILLTDIMMPYMNGIELAKNFNRLLPETKIFFMSGYVYQTLTIKELPDEEYLVFEKPFSIDRLNHEFSKALTL